MDGMWLLSHKEKAGDSSVFNDPQLPRTRIDRSLWLRIMDETSLRQGKCLDVYIYILYMYIYICNIYIYIIYI